VCFIFSPYFIQNNLIDVFCIVNLTYFYVQMSSFWQIYGHVFKAKQRENWAMNFIALKYWASALQKSNIGSLLHASKDIMPHLANTCGHKKYVKFVEEAYLLWKNEKKIKCCGWNIPEKCKTINETCFHGDHLIMTGW